jgi:hypothetical protein
LISWPIKSPLEKKILTKMNKQEIDYVLQKLAAEQQQPLKPGIYIGARKINMLNSKLLRDVMPGRHQFYILIPKNPANFRGKLRDLGNGVKGIVMGANQKKGQLYSKTTLPAEIQAAEDFVGGTNKYKYDPDVQRIDVKGKSIDKTIHVMLRMQKHFEKMRKKNPIPYQFASMGKALNSNAWAQSIGEYAGLKNRVKDFKGIDPGTHDRVPEEYFKKAANMNNEELRQRLLHKTADKNSDRNAMIAGAGLGGVGGALLTMATAALIGGRGAKWWETAIGTTAGAAAGAGAARGVLELSRRYIANRATFGIMGYNKGNPGDINTKVRNVLLPDKFHSLYIKALDKSYKAQGDTKTAPNLRQITGLNLKGLGAFVSEMWKTRNDEGGLLDSNNWKQIWEDATTKPNLEKMVTDWKRREAYRDESLNTDIAPEVLDRMGGIAAMGDNEEGKKEPPAWRTLRQELFARGLGVYDDSKGSSFTKANPKDVETLRNIYGKAITDVVMMPKKFDYSQNTIKPPRGRYGDEYEEEMAPNGEMRKVRKLDYGYDETSPFFVYKKVDNQKPEPLSEEAITALRAGHRQEIDRLVKERDQGLITPKEFRSRSLKLADEFQESLQPKTGSR